MAEVEHLDSSSLEQQIHDIDESMAFSEHKLIHAAQSEPQSPPREGIAMVIPKPS